jgi:DNA ligase-1
MTKLKKTTTPFNVMLAHPYGKRNFNRDSFIQPKLDGIRCYITKDGAFSRNHKEFKTVEHIKEAFKPLFKEDPQLILDGELYNHQLKNDFNKIISLVRKKNPSKTETEDAEKYIQFHWYDYCNFNQKNEEVSAGFCLRNMTIRDTISQINSRHIIEVPTHDVSIIESAKLWHKDFLEQGYEGSILRLNKPYEQKRSYNLQKFKDFQDSEATITGWVEGQGKRTGTIGKFLARDSHGNEFGMPVMDNYKIMEKMYDIADWYIGKTATFTYFQRTPAGSYRHPLYKCIRNYE